MSLNREDVMCFQRLAEDVDLNNLPYRRVIELYSQFIRTLLHERESHKFDLSDAFVAEAFSLLDSSDKFFLNELSPVQLEKERVKAWNIYDKENGATKHLARAIVCCLYEEDSGEDFSNEDLFELFLSILLDLGSGFCEKFEDYVKKGTQEAHE